MSNFIAPSRCLPLEESYIWCVLSRLFMFSNTNMVSLRYNHQLRVVRTLTYCLL
jgi:hypothetical protein